MYRIQQIKLRTDEPESRLKEKILKKLGRRDIVITELKIVRKSIDARNRDDICFVYTLDFEAVYRKKPKEQARLKCGGRGGLEVPGDESYHPAEPGSEELAERPVIAGFGPCGMFAALILAEAGYRPIVIERGKDADSRTEDVKAFWDNGILNTESNVQFGEGGAGTFSDGKLTTGIKDVRIKKVLEELVEAGAPADILYLAKPHVGTDILRTVVKNIRKKIIRLGGEVRFQTKLSALEISDGRLTGIKVEKPAASGRSGKPAGGPGRSGEESACTHAQTEGKPADTGTQPGAEPVTEHIPASELILGIGHSARDTFEMLKNCGVSMKQKPFSIGVRIEHPQDVIDMAQYGRLSRGYADHGGQVPGLPPADYKISWRTESGRGVYTFCMCPGGKVVMAASEAGGVVTNGMSESRRDSGTANSALLVDVRPEDFGSEDVLAGVAFQRKWEQAAFRNGGGAENRAPKTTWKEFRDGAPGAVPVTESIPDFAVEAIREAMPHLGRKLKGFDADEAVLTAVESRSSSPVRIERGEDMESSIAGLRPCGEGAGYAGGIVSAACDGIKAAEKIISRYRRPGQ